MNCKIIFFIYFSFFTIFGFSQTEKIISGKILVKNASPGGVHIINLVNEKEVISNEKGEFKILAKVDDLLVFSSLTLDYQRKIIEIKDYNSGFFTMEMTAKINQLDEVEIVNYNKINAVDLGILYKKPKAYTPAERKLRTATSLDPTLSVGNMAGVSMSLDPLLNVISGRTKQLKKELQIERKEFAILKMAELFPFAYFVEQLKIPKDYAKAFQYYCVEKKDFIPILKSKNKTLIAFKLSELAVEYKNLLNEKK
ncbi:MAG: hypothetical protein H7250_10105 [Flavobacterium sp.]|nr:hypothetical protein [Flavobacterium sp.]